MFVIRRKSDGLFATRSKWEGSDRFWTDNIEKARVFRRIEDAKQSSRYAEKRTDKPLPKYPERGDGRTWMDYQREMRAWEKSREYPKDIPVYIEPVVLLPISLIYIPGVKKQWQS